MSLQTLPIGWTWSLFFCHRVLTERMVCALQRSVPSQAAVEGQVLVDRRHAPRIRPGLPVLAGYAKNGNFICWNSTDGVSAIHHISIELESCGLAFRFEECSSSSGVSIGLVLRLGKRLIHAKPSRMLELRRSLHELIEQRYASGKVLQKFNGHFWVLLSPFAAACSPFWKAVMSLRIEAAGLPKSTNELVENFELPLDCFCSWCTEQGNESVTPRTAVTLPRKDSPCTPARCERMSWMTLLRFASAGVSDLWCEGLVNLTCTPWPFSPPFFGA